MTDVESDAYDSPQALAQAFGSAILVPSWWASDTGAIEYSLQRSRREYYQAGSVRHGGAPISVMGWLEVPGARSPGDWLVGEWSEPDEFTAKRGLIGRIGYPPRLQAVIYDENLEIQLIGYVTEEEIFRAVSSLRRVGPE